MKIPNYLIKYFLIFLLFSTINTNAYSFEKNLRLLKDTIVDKNNLRNYTDCELIILRSSIYANYGFIFDQKWLDIYFKQQTWYHPSKDFSYNMLTKNDLYSSDLILQEYYHRKYYSGKTSYLVDDKKYKTKYFLTISINKTLPDNFLISIAEESNKDNKNIKSNIELYRAVFQIEYLSATPLVEGTFNGPPGTTPDNGYGITIGNKRYVYFYEVKYYKNNSIRSIQKYYTGGPGVNAKPKYIFSENGQLICVVQTYMGIVEFSNAYIEYYNNKIVFIEYCFADLNSLSINDLDKYIKSLEKVRIYEKSSSNN